MPLVRKPDARKSHIRFDERDLETEETVRYSDTDKPKGSETVTAEPNSTAPDLDSTRRPRKLGAAAERCADFLAALKDDWKLPVKRKRVLTPKPQPPREERPPEISDEELAKVREESRAMFDQLRKSLRGGVKP